jgi:hypothetical protein
MKFRFRYTECKQTCDRYLLVALIGVATSIIDMLLKFGSAQDENEKITDLSAGFIVGMWRQYLLVEISSIITKGFQTDLRVGELLCEVGPATINLSIGQCARAFSRFSQV